MSTQEVEKVESELPIPDSWRNVFSQIVSCFVENDYSISKQIDGLRPVTEDTAVQIKEYLADYGEKLIELPEQAWETSIFYLAGFLLGRSG